MKKEILVERRRFLIRDSELIMDFVCENAREANKKLIIQGVVDEDSIYKIQIDVIKTLDSAPDGAEQMCKHKTKVVRVDGITKRVPIDYSREDNSSSMES